MEVLLSRTSILIEGELITGETVKFDGMYWIVVHVDYINRVAYLGSTTCVSLTVFGKNNTYKGSTLQKAAANFESNMSNEAKAVMKSVTQDGVTAKVFPPTYDQVSGGFDYFNSDDRRICKYNGSAEYWWASSPSTKGNAYCVTSEGYVTDDNISVSNGFRPFVAVTL